MKIDAKILDPLVNSTTGASASTLKPLGISNSSLLVAASSVVDKKNLPTMSFEGVEAGIEILLSKELESKLLALTLTLLYSEWSFKSKAIEPPGLTNVVPPSL